MPTPDENAGGLPNGPAWATLVAAGIGCSALGIVVGLAEAFRPVSKALTLYAPAGDLSGKSAVAVVVWLAAWAFLHARWHDRRLRSARRLTGLTVGLVGIGLVATFPPVFDHLAGR